MTREEVGRKKEIRKVDVINCCDNGVINIVDTIDIC